MTATNVKLTDSERRVLAVLREMERTRVHRKYQNILGRLGWNGERGVSRLYETLNELEAKGLVARKVTLAMVDGPGVSPEGLKLLKRAA